MAWFSQNLCYVCALFRTTFGSIATGGGPSFGQGFGGMGGNQGIGIGTGM